MNNLNRVPVKKEYIPSSATVTLSAQDFNNLIQLVEDTESIKQQLRDRYQVCLDDVSWDDKKYLRIEVRPFPTQGDMAQALAERLAADSDVMAYLVGSDKQAFDFNSGCFYSQAWDDPHRINLMDIKVFADAWKLTEAEIAGIIDETEVEERMAQDAEKLVADDAEEV